MAGLRERKKEETRQRIAAAAQRLFVEHGFDEVTVNEIAEAAGVAKATLFAYFPTKESLALQGVGDDDLAGIVAGRRGCSPLGALRAHYRALTSAETAAETSTETSAKDGSTAPDAAPAPDREELLARVRVIVESPTLSAAANGLRYQQRQALAQVLEEEHGASAAALMAAQIAASLLTLQESYFRRLMDGEAPQDAGRAMAEDLELAFDLLEHGIADLKGPHHAGR